MKGYFLGLFMLTAIAAFGQAEEEEPADKPASRNAKQLYVELLGPGGFYSINYDFRFGQKEKGLGMRAGASAIFAGGDGFVSLPVGLNYLAGRKGNYMELGGGASLVTGEDFLEGSGVYGYLTMGYRRQAYRKRGITWRANFSPLFFFEGGFTLIPWVGFSLGYRF